MSKAIIMSLGLRLLYRYYLMILDKSLKLKSSTGFDNPNLKHRDLAISIPQYDTHTFFYNPNIRITCQHSIGVLRRLCLDYNVKSVRLSYNEIVKLIEDDLNNSIDEISKIRNHVKSVRKHEYEELIIVFHIPSGKYLLVDGRHRLIEHEKFKPHNAKMTAIIVDSEFAGYAIIHRTAYIAHRMEHNLFFLDNLPLGEALSHYMCVLPLLYKSSK